MDWNIKEKYSKLLYNALRIYGCYRQIPQNALKEFIGLYKQNPENDIQFIKRVSNEIVFFYKKKKTKYVLLTEYMQKRWKLPKPLKK